MTNSRVIIEFPLSGVLSAKLNSLGTQEGEARFHGLPPLQKRMDNGDSGTSIVLTRRKKRQIILDISMKQR